MTKKLFLLLAVSPLLGACDSEQTDGLGEIGTRASTVELDDLSAQQLESFDGFSFDFNLKVEGLDLELVPQYGLGCKDGQQYKLDSHQTSETCEEGVIYRVTYMVRTEYVCVDGEWNEGTSSCPVDQPCFDVEKTAEEC